jgi:hypothetical protein
VLALSAVKSLASSGRGSGVEANDVIYDDVPVQNGAVSQVDLQRGFSNLAARNTGQDNPLGF